MHRRVVRARRWRYTIGAMLLVVSIWTYYIFCYWRIKTVKVKDKDVEYFGEDGIEGNTAYQFMPLISRNSNARQNSEKTVPQKVVILITQFRSGSSFIGKVLSASKGTMYLSEPLLPFGLDCTAMQDRKLALISRILTCDFSNLQREYDIGFKQSHFPNTGDCASKGYCLPYASVGLLKGYSAVCNWMYFKRTTVTDFNPKSPSCGFPLKEHILNEQCLNSKIIAIKVTRVCTVKELQKTYDFLTSKGRDVYVVHLVRDPRSTIFSRIKAWNEDPVNTTKEVCKRLRMNLEVLNISKPVEKSNATGPGLVTHGRYFRIRFEDISMNVLLWTERLFRFIGSDMSPGVGKKILSELEQDSKNLTKLNDSEQNTETKEHSNWVNSPFTVMKDSKEVLQRWRKTISWKLMQDVQHECADVLESLGYTLFNNEQTLKNTSIPFFKP